MIIRGYVECKECSFQHVIRIGMGLESQQRHRFACHSCHEDIEVGLDVDYQNISAVIFYGENTREIDPVSDSPIVNIDANFIIPDDLKGKDFAFPRLEQGAKMVQKIIEMRREKGLPDFPLGEALKRSGRPNFAEEWNDCRAAWSLFRNGKNDLTNKRIARASATTYQDDPLTDMADWAWRIAARLTQPAFEQHFLDGMAQLREAQKNQDYQRFVLTYKGELSVSHGRMFFELLRGYFASFDEFAQVFFLVTSGTEFPNGTAASSNFDAVRMFYGNAFEGFSSGVEFLAYMNNLVAGRRFDEFQTMSRSDYLKLDKSSRFNCFAENQAFNAIAIESDNTLRNASHHGDFHFDKQSQQISYRAGKGGQGEQNQITYTEYLRRSTVLFVQAMVLFRLELVFASNAGIRPPL